jgi:hypothetical protein
MSQGKRTPAAVEAGSVSRSGAAKHSARWRVDRRPLPLQRLSDPHLAPAGCSRATATTALLIRRNIADGDLCLLHAWRPVETPIKTLVSVEGHRWAIEDSFETAKNELGLDYNETRSWHGWHRHVSLVMLAFAMMAVSQDHANKLVPKKPSGHLQQSSGRSRKSVA